MEVQRQRRTIDRGRREKPFSAVTTTLQLALSTKTVLAIAIAVFVLFIRVAAADIQDSELIPSLEATEALFKAMKEKNYPKIWSLITKKSHDIIIEDVRKAIAKTDTHTSADSLQTDFASGGRYAQEYWEAYLKVFDPDIALEQSKWEMGKRINKNEREIILRYRKSAHPAILKIYKEDDSWKVGLEETFRARRLKIPELR